MFFILFFEKYVNDIQTYYKITIIPLHLALNEVFLSFGNISFIFEIEFIFHKGLV